MSERQVIGGRFEIADPERDLLGRGGMGDVYRGMDLHTGEPIAIKGLRPEVVSGIPDAIARFLREGEALRELDHHNIVKLVDAVQEDGRHYLVVEYIPGGSLRDLLETQGRLPVERTVETALEVADALTRAHHLGIIHRDLKPSNVLLAEDGTPRLTDFGIAQLASGPRLTGADRAVGTVDYMSPEACNLEPLDTRTDVWSFGVMLYEMLAGQRPFVGDSPLATLTAILTQSLPDLQRLCPDLPDALVDLVYRMLEKDRQQRIPSVRMVGAELETIGRAVSDQPSAPVRVHSRLRQVQVSSTVSGQQPAVSNQQSAVSGQRSLTASRFATPTPPAEAPRHNLPIQPTPFVGREAELVELERLLSDPEVRLVTVIGAGGMGKTRLALQTAEVQLARFNDGVYFVSLAPLQSAGAIVPTIAETLGFTFYAGDGPRQQLLGYLREKRLLLLMDNWEHLLEGVDILADILRTAPEVKVLSTSRARLNVQGEHLFRLAGMEFPALTPAPSPARGRGELTDSPEPTSLTLQDALEYSAVKLFMQGARRVRPGYELETDDLRYVSRICRLVGGMPLGILLAAAWIEMLTPEEIAGEIERGLDFLEDSSRDLPGRQRSVRAVFDHSWDLLTGREQDVLAALSVFLGGFTRDAAQQVAGASLRELRSLVGKSLLHRAPTGRYAVHELLRQYAAEKLSASPSAERTVHDGHSAYYTLALERWGEDLKGPRKQRALIEIEADSENARTAWNWAVEQEQIDRLDRAMEGLQEFYWARGRYQDGVAVFQRAADQLAESPGDTRGAEHVQRVRVLAAALAYQSNFWRVMGRGELAVELQRKSLALLEGPDLAEGDTRRERGVLFWLMGHSVLMSDFERGRQLYERSLALFRATGDRWGTAHALMQLGIAAGFLGSVAEAKQWFEESLDIFADLGDRGGIARCVAELAEVAVFQGRFGEAERLARESSATSAQLGDDSESAYGLLVLGETLTSVGKFAEAHSRLEGCLAIFRELGRHSYISSAHAALGSADLHLGRYDEARAHVQTGLSWAREHGPRFRVGSSLVVLGQVALAEGAVIEARRSLQEGVAIYQDIGEQISAGWALALLGYAVRELGDANQARQHLYAALRAAVETETVLPLMDALPAIALHLADQDLAERSVELYALASHHPHVSNSRWFEDVVGSRIAALAATLPPDVVVAARQRGQARDLWATAEELMEEFGAD